VRKQFISIRLPIFLVISFLGSLLLLSSVTSIAYGLMTKEKLAEMVKEKNEQDGITQESIIKKEQDDWNKYLEAREYNRLSPYEKRFLEITNNHYGTNYSSLEEATLGEYERYLNQMDQYESELRELD